MLFELATESHRRDFIFDCRPPVKTRDDLFTEFDMCSLVNGGVNFVHLRLRDRYYYNSVSKRLRTHTNRGANAVERFPR